MPAFFVIDIMRYSLLSRFQGTLLGAILGEIYGSQFSSKSSPTLGVGSRIALLGTQSLIRCGKLDLADWMQHTGLPDRSVLASETAIATIPVALFFHENSTQLRQEVKSAATVWNQTGEPVEGVLAVGDAIAQALTGKLQPASLIPQLLANLPDNQTPAIEQLAQVQDLLVPKCSLETAKAKLCRGKQSHLSPVAMGFYCFLSTPEDFRLSVRRAVKSGCQPRITAAIAGALSGAYNSLSGIPLQWSLSGNHVDREEILQLTARLLATWSGVYDPIKCDRLSRLTVAAPRTMR